MRSWVFLIGGFFALTSFTLVQAVQAKTKIPVLTGPVVDQAGLLTDYEKQALDQKIRSQTNAAQVQLWILPKLQTDETIEELSIRAVDEWKLGDAKKDNGLLLLIALDDRKMRIEVGQGLEAVIPDLIASRIIREVLAPNFRTRAYAAGLGQAIEMIQELARGEFQSGSSSQLNSRPGIRSFSVSFWIFIIFIMLAFIRTFFQNLRDYWRWRSHGFNPRGHTGIRKSYRHDHGMFSDGFGRGGFGGGGWSGGGGGFSGGGSSGNW